MILTIRQVRIKRMLISFLTVLLTIYGAGAVDTKCVKSPSSTPCPNNNRSEQKNHAPPWRMICSSSPAPHNLYTAPFKHTTTTQTAKNLTGVAKPTSYTANIPTPYNSPIPSPFTNGAGAIVDMAIGNLVIAAAVQGAIVAGLSLMA